MSTITTALTQFSDGPNARTYSLPGHTVAAPKLAIQKRKVPASTSSVGSSNVQVVYGAFDAAGIPLASKVVFDANVRYPADARSTEITAALAIYRELVASDEFTAMVTGQVYLKA